MEKNTPEPVFFYTVMKKMHLHQLLQYERFIPYMTEEEHRQLASGRTDFPLSRIAEWNDALRAHTQYINNIFPHYVKQ